jgi:hypothetical protein
MEVTLTTRRPIKDECDLIVQHKKLYPRSKLEDKGASTKSVVMRFDKLYIYIYIFTLVITRQIPPYLCSGIAVFAFRSRSIIPTKFLEFPDFL